MTTTEFNKLPPAEQLIELRMAMLDCAARCKTNMLTAGTWIEHSFSGAADRLKTIERQIKRGNRRETRKA